ncbi:carboxypeptidase-like regulatory domain-containing protein [Reichenbachiella ulvae]|uniref:Carboxypeptidase-like regulatory domain-containing protein n=1 Tax=Reichenbachiella ulvae TaxID=2980104 RepID=A0ABT3CWK7_9BACT|nr:carboxypeptidase-like regulatory domain-containing protein [Reichenbachiella ulvae]MCV9387982.1 carboxypeptidase-like regulatory domain-containing protein [Reichenbachiella ulvae]
MKQLLTSILTLLILFSFTEKSLGQEENKVIQFSGIVIDQEVEQGIPGVHIYAPKSGRGTTTNPYGYFSMAVLEGDSMIVSAVGYEKEKIRIPRLMKDRDSYTVVINLKGDTTYLDELEVYPFPSEEMFKEAVLALQLPNQQDLNNMRRNTDQRMLYRMSGSLSMGASGNYEYYMQQQAQAQNLQYQPNSISLLNPFAWNQFIKSIKKRKQE